MELEVQICTYKNEGLENVSKMRLPKLDNVSYTICFQNPEKTFYILPESLKRDDIRILEHTSKGLSNNRNFGIDHAIADIILFADDDLNYFQEGLEKIIQVFENNPGIEFATFKHIGADNKRFPEYEFEFGKREPKGYYLTSFELAVRRESLPNNIRFSPDFGIGAPLFGAAEENIFLLSMIRQGLRGRFFPIIIAEHPELTTGNKKASPEFLRAQGAWFRIRYGRIEGFVRLIRDIPRRNAPYLESLFIMLEGFIKSHWKKIMTALYLLCEKDIVYLH